MSRYTGHGKEEPGLTTARQALQQALFRSGFNRHRRGGTLAKEVTVIRHLRESGNTAEPVTTLVALIGTQ